MHFKDEKNEKNDKIWLVNLCSGANNSVNFVFWYAILDIHQK